MKFLHAADIHLDSPLAGLMRRDDVPGHVTHDATRRAFTNLIDLAITEGAAFVLIAGDLYDSNWRDFNTGLFFAREMRRLDRPCILIRGNHDAGSVLTRHLHPPPNVTVLSPRKVETHVLEAHGVAIHGQSFPNRAVTEDLSAAYPPPRAGLFNVGLLHTSADDPGEHETYAPCRVESLALKGYDYWALGHIHARRTLHERPWIVFPGNIQGRHVRETGAKGCTLVEVRHGRVESIEHRATDVLRWAQIAVDLDGAATLEEVALRLRFALSGAQDAAEGRPLIARVTLTGATPQHAAILADPDAIEAECRNAAAAAGPDVFVEQVRTLTRPPAAAAAAGADDQLAAVFHAALDDPALLQDLLAELRSLAGQVPHLPGRAPPDLPLTEAALRALAPDAWQVVAHRLAGGGAA
jgi:exonuclease SbcD